MTAHGRGNDAVAQPMETVMEKRIEVEVLVGWSEAQILRVQVEHRATAKAIAKEAAARAAFLRSRPMSEDRGLQMRERLVLAELDALAARARVAALAEERGTVTEAAARKELDALDLEMFAAFQRFDAFAAAIDAPFPMRARPLDPRQRAEELAAIERFLAERK